MNPIRWIKTWLLKRKSKKFVEAIKSRKKTGKESLATALSRIQELESRLNAMEALSDLEAEEQG